MKVAGEVFAVLSILVFAAPCVVGAHGSWVRPRVAPPAALSRGPGDKAREAAQTSLKHLLSDLKSERETVRERAALALGERKEAKALRPLIAALGDRYGTVRKAAAWALGELGDKHAVLPLTAVLGDTKRSVRDAAGESLQRLKSKSPVEAAGRARQRPEVTAVEAPAPAVATAGKTPPGVLEEVEPEDRVEAQPVAAATIAEQPLAAPDAPEAARAEELATQAPVPQPEMVAEAAERSPEPTPGPTAPAAVQTEGAAPEAENAEVVQCPPSADAIAEALRSPDRALRRGAAGALVEPVQGLEPDRKVELLAAAAGDADVFVRQAALNAAAASDAAGAAGLLVQILRDEAAGLRRQAAQALGQRRSPLGIAPLLSALRDEDLDVRGQAAQALGEIGGRTTATALLRTLGDPDPTVRAGAADALGDIRDPRATSALILALQDKAWIVRRDAAAALGALGAAEAVDPLIRVLDDDAPGVRWAASRALATLTGMSFGEDPELWRDWRYSPTRRLSLNR